jgi:hypothetical protein
MALLVCIAVSACGESGPPRKAVFPVKGQVFFKSQPAAGAKIIFRPQTGDDPKDWPTGFPNAEVSTDGTFEVGTYEEKDGAPPGDYVVLLIWPEATNEDEEAATVDKLGGRYSDPANSQHRAKVNDAPTELPPIRIQ